MLMTSDGTWCDWHVAHGDSTCDVFVSTLLIGQDSVWLINGGIQWGCIFYITDAC